ncbi:peptidase inhibitor 16-like isoform X2 [Neoarius graeffei]|uniref:peptidase inhibitor 16-like isoform X2 n=1 Tax=Neoarius graeffei TaxID=443677 RepID=UPI00298C3730|nr:peptidase inhibitor 16-like isoform X2 [Neoarius graeffei]
MIWKTALHYAQFWFVLALVSGQLTVEQQEEILDLHNQYRGMVSPEAADMLHMTWNESLALVAQSYAVQCSWEHNPDATQLGENLFITTSQLSINKAMANWFDERANYDYDSDSCLLNMCGHYTQIVWAKSKTVGCGARVCETVQNLDFEGATILVCNYYPQGNIEGVQPYEKGQPCSNCPQEMSECIEKTCGKTQDYSRTTNGLLNMTLNHAHELIKFSLSN